MGIRFIKCASCGVEVQAKSNKKYCSVACYKASKRLAGKSGQECVWCGKKMGRWHSRFCSAACLVADWEARRPKCKNPGCENHVRTASNRFCSRKCWREYTHGTRVCIGCGKPYIQERAAHGRRCRKCYNLYVLKRNRTNRAEPTFRTATAVRGRGVSLADTAI